MSRDRTLTQIEFEAEAGIRLEFDADGWRIQVPRTLGEKTLAHAQAQGITVVPLLPM